MLTGRTIALLVTMALAAGGAAWGVHALMSAAGDVGTDYGLDTNGNGTFDWPVVEWNYTTKTYAASQFEQPMRPATFTGDHSDSAVDLDGDGLADFLELRADVHVNLAGHYALNGYLSKGAGTDVVRLIAYGYRDPDLATTDTTVVLRFRW